MREREHVQRRPSAETAVSSLIPEALSQLSSVFRRRFLFNALLPTFVFASSLVGLVVYTFSSFTTLDKWWTGQDIFGRAIIVLGYLAGIWFASGAIASQWRNIVRLFEGYPIRAILGRRVPGTSWHRERARLMWVGAEYGEVDEDAKWPDAVQAYAKYPLIDDTPDGDNEQYVLPTRLGNILRAAELYPLSRYGTDSIYFWPRLFPLLPKQFQDDYEKFLQQYEFPLVVAFQAGVTSTLGGILLVFSHAPVWLFLTWFTGGNLFAYALYWLSLGNATELGEQQRTAFDLYRHLLLEQWPTPLDVRDEKEAFELIEGFIVSNQSPAWQKSQSAHSRRADRRTSGQGVE